jgi:hypothetical protein
VSDFFREVRMIDGRQWVPLADVSRLLPDPSRAAWVDPEMQGLLVDMKADGAAGIVVLWQKETNEMSTISMVEDATEIAEALEHAAKRYRDPAFVAERRLAELEPGG